LTGQTEDHVPWICLPQDLPSIVAVINHNSLYK